MTAAGRPIFCRPNAMGAKITVITRVALHCAAETAAAPAELRNRAPRILATIKNPVAHTPWAAAWRAPWSLTMSGHTIFCHHEPGFAGATGVATGRGRNAGASAMGLSGSGGSDSARAWSCANRGSLRTGWKRPSVLNRDRPLERCSTARFSHSNACS